MNHVHVLRLQNTPIFQQLQLEEALLRADDRNWCLINEGTPPAIVMGISGKVEQMINREKLRQNPIPVIRRFSGGGTVVVDGNTIFTTLIFNKETVQVSCCPKKILYWTGDIYRPFLEKHDFQIKENDYALGDRKFGGNAQYMSKARWLHHTSHLWDYEADQMEYLLFPPKVPTYRATRSHEEFLCKLNAHLPDKQTFIDQFLDQLRTRFTLSEVVYNQALMILDRPHRQSTTLLVPLPVPG